jgi:DNA-binding beta-propeller fold protein YncE
MRSAWVLVLWIAVLSVGLVSAGVAQTLPPAQSTSTYTRPVGANPSASTVLRRVGMIHLRGQPGFASLALAGDQLIMSHSTTNTVDVFDVAKRQIVAQVTDMNDPSGIAVDEAAGKAYVANRGANEIAVLSTRDWKVEKRIPLDSSPRSLLLVPQTGKLYSANWHQRSLSVVDLKQGTAHTVAIDGSPVRMAWDAERQQLYVTLEDSHAVEVLGPALEQRRRFVIQGYLPTGIAYDAKRQRIYVAVRNAIVSLNPESGQEVGRSAAPDGVDTLQFTGDYLFAAATGGTVLVYQPTSSGLVAEHEVPTGVRGHAIAYDAQRNLILLPGGSDGTAKLLILQLVPRAQQPATVSAIR